MSRSPEELQGELWSHWTKQLYREYDNILFQYGVKLRQPLIRITDVGATWGTWDAKLRCISIARRLIERHAWDVVVEILKHEMAHQWVTDHYGDGGAPHGERFLTACRRLGVADWAARASGDLPAEIVHWKERALSPDEERLLKRAEKLLALAASANEHEALLAMQRVRELYARYNIDRIRAGLKDGMVHLVVTRRQKRTSQAESMIYSLLTQFFFVKVVMGTRYDAADCCDYRIAEILGTRENVLMAEYVYHFLWNKAHALWDDYRQRHAAPGNARPSFLLGVLVGFREKLAKQEAAASAAPEVPREEARALVARGDAELEAWVEQRYPRLSTRRFSTTYADNGSFVAGHSEGGRLTLNRPIERSDGVRGRLLGAGNGAGSR